MTKVVLLTSFQPETGGGGAILRSILPILEAEYGLDVEWNYMAPQPPASREAGRRYLGPMPIRGGWRSLVDFSLQWGGLNMAALHRIVDKVLERPAPVYWVVGDMESVLLAELLAQRGFRVHLTMHDDLAHGQFARSRRFKRFTAIADWRLGRAIKAAATLDVVCPGMGDYYAEKFGAQSVVVHRYLPPLPEQTPPTRETGVISAGHIGSIYSVKEFSAFCNALREYAKRQGLRAQFLVIAGSNVKTAEMLEEHKDIVTQVGHSPESEAIDRLRACDFMYAMYPFDNKLSVFRRTSSPTKVTTYLQAQRPVLAHTPADSSLHGIVTDYKLGRSCSSLEMEPLIAEIGRIHEDVKAKRVRADSYEKARQALHGEDNIRNLAECLKEGRYSV